MWLLLLLVSPEAAMTPVGTFESRAGCIEAGNVAVGYHTVQRERMEFVVDFVCVPKGEPID